MYLCRFGADAQNHFFQSARQTAPTHLFTQMQHLSVLCEVLMLPQALRPCNFNPHSQHLPIKHSARASPLDINQPVHLPSRYAGL
jgi:hypothetical protein